MESPLHSPPRGGGSGGRRLPYGYGYSSRSPLPGRYTPSPTPRRRPSPTRSRSPTPRRNGRYASEPRSLSRDRDSRGRSESPLRGSTKIVVEKLTKTINEDHLYEIFGHYGQIRDLDLPMNRQFNTNRGTAYILYVHEADAEAAIAHMHEAQVDGAIINVSIVLPRRKFSPSPPTASRGANIDPRVPAPGYRGGRGPGGRGGGRGGYGGFGPGRYQRSPPRYGGPGAHGGRPDRDSFTYRPRSVSPRSRSPPLRRGRSRSPSHDSRSRSPPRRRSRLDDYHEYDDRRRSPSRGSYNSYRERSRSRSRSGGRVYR